MIRGESRRFCDGGLVWAEVEWKDRGEDGKKRKGKKNSRGSIFDPLY